MKFKFGILLNKLTKKLLNFSINRNVILKLFKDIS
jgi:hypothetical protein